MHFSDSSHVLLKMLADVTPRVYLVTGQNQMVVADDQMSVAQTELTESMPVDFGAYNMPQFLTNLQLMPNYQLSFVDKHVIITDGDMTLKYNGTDIRNFTILPTVDIDGIFNKPHKAEFFMSTDLLEKLEKISLNNGFTHQQIIDDGTKMEIIAFSKGVDTTNTFNWKIGPSTGIQFKSMIKREHSKIAALDYRVQVCEDGVVKFFSTKLPIKYVVMEDALEDNNNDE
jgi:hypothetical protein